MKTLIVIGCALIGLMDYCCCVMAASADQRMEKLPSAPMEGGGSDG